MLDWNARGAVDTATIEMTLSTTMGATAAGPLLESPRSRAAGIGPMTVEASRPSGAAVPASGRSSKTSSGGLCLPGNRSQSSFADCDQRAC